MSNVFRALRARNYRLYFGGQLASLIGTWMQIIGQSWLVWKMTGSGLNVGIVSAMQFTPILLAGAWGGLVVDRYPKRRILLVTQVSFAVSSAALGLLVTAGWVELWMVYALALVYGAIMVVDMPARQAFVPEMVPRGDVMSAVSLNISAFNGARLVGPGVAALVIANTSIGVCFWANALSFVPVIVALALMRESELHDTGARPATGRGQIRAGLRYVAREPALLYPLILMAVVGTLGFNFQIVLPLFADITFDGGVGTYGAMSSVLATGSIVGALFAASRSHPTDRLLVISAFVFGVMLVVTALAPTLAAAYAVLPVVGLATIVFVATSNATLQLRSSPEMRGRVLGLFSLVLLGSTPIGGPMLGWISEEWSPRAALAVGGAGNIVAAIVIGAILLARRRRDPHPRPVTRDVAGADAIIAGRRPVSRSRSRTP